MSNFEINWIIIYGAALVVALIGVYAYFNMEKPSESKRMKKKKA